MIKKPLICIFCLVNSFTISENFAQNLLQLPKLETVYYIASTPKGWAILRKFEDESTNGKEPYETVKVLPFSK